MLCDVVSGFSTQGHHFEYLNLNKPVCPVFLVSPRFESLERDQPV